MPYHLPDESEIGSCVISFDIPTDEKWVSVLIGAISELALAENWEAGTGDLTVDEATQVAIEILDSVGFQAC